MQEPTEKPPFTGNFDITYLLLLMPLVFGQFPLHSTYHSTPAHCAEVLPSLLPAPQGHLHIYPIKGTAQANFILDLKL